MAYFVLAASAAVLVGIAEQHIDINDAKISSWQGMQNTDVQLDASDVTAVNREIEAFKQTKPAGSIFDRPNPRARSYQVSSKNSYHLP